jgi:predicted enzyme related to lactoylglutathione lyase
MNQLHSAGATATLQEAFKEVDMVDMHLEVDIIPVSDVERSKQFYGRLGWRLDDDVAPTAFASSSSRPPGRGAR